MTEWYEAVGSNDPLSQGDIVLDCPIATWADEEVAHAAPNPGDPLETLKAKRQIIKENVIVMTQACDLAQGNVREVVLCPVYDLVAYRDKVYVPAKKRVNPDRKINKDSFKNFCENVKKGYVWNLSLLNPVEVPNFKVGHRFVDFHAIYTVPRSFLDSLVRHRAQGRLRLVSPYREHLSQSFARYFMRVGLPPDNLAPPPDVLTIPDALR